MIRGLYFTIEERSDPKVSDFRAAMDKLKRLPNFEKKDTPTTPLMGAEEDRMVKIFAG